MTKHEYQNPNQLTNDEASVAGARLQRVTQSSSVPIRIKPQQVLRQRERCLRCPHLSFGILSSFGLRH
jgi:hypothetical protein